MAMTTRSVIPPAVRDYYDRLFLTTAYPPLVHNRHALKKRIPKNSGDQMVFRRMSRLATVPVPLQDGVTPAAAPLAKTDVKAQVEWYGNYVIVTDQVQMVVENDMMNEAAVLLGQNAGQTMDELARDVLATLATVVSATNGSNGNTPTEMTKADFNTVVKTLVGSDAQMITRVQKGINAFGTAPVRPAFWGYMHTDLLDDLETVSNFQPVSSYPNQAEVQDSEWGASSNIRFYYTSVGLKSAASPAVYAIPIVGVEAYADVHLGSEAIEYFMDEPGGNADPLHQRGTVAMKFAYVCRVLNDAFGLQFLCTHS